MYKRKGERMGGNSKLILKIAAIFLVITGIFCIMRMQLSYNELLERRAELEKQIIANSEKIEKMQNELDEEFDEEYVERVARDKLNMCLPEEIIFYSDLTK